jgi:hypothetical protein
MNPDLCFEYQQLMLRYNEKNKALNNVQQKNTEMRSKSTKQRHLEIYHEKKINKVFENEKSTAEKSTAEKSTAEKSTEKVEIKKNNNNVSTNENKKIVFKLFNKILKNKNLENK